MNDLLLWRLLDSPDEQPEELVKLLEEACAGSVQDRFPYLGRISGILESGNPRLRALGVRFLEAAHGYLAYCRIVAALDDEHPEVRKAAVAALWTSVSRHDHGRWLHALFHRRKDVRTAALEMRTVPGTASMHLCLAADPELGPCALDKLRSVDLNDGHVAVVLDLVDAARISAVEARRLLSALPYTRWEELMTSLTGMETSFRHTLVRALRLFLVGEASTLDEDARENCREFFSQLAHVALSKKDGISDALGRIVQTTIEQHGKWTVRACELYLLTDPLVAGLPEVHLEIRRESLRVLFEFSGQLRPASSSDIDVLIKSDVCRRSDGDVDLWAVAAILQGAKNPYRRLFDCFKMKKIVSAFLKDIDSSVWLFTLSNESSAHEDLMKAITRRRRPAVPSILAAAACVPGLAISDMLAQANSTALVNTITRLFQLQRSTGLEPAERRRHLIAIECGQRINPREIPSVLASWLDEFEPPESSALGVAFLGEVARRLTPSELFKVLTSLSVDHLLRILRAIEHCSTFPHGKEMHLVNALKDHRDTRVQAWVEERSSGVSEPVAHDIAVAEVDSLPRDLAKKIATCPHVDLERTLRPVFRGRWRGVTAAFNERGAGAEPSALVCSVLLASHDPLAEIEREFARFGSNEPAFLAELDPTLVQRWQAIGSLGILVHAWLHRWECHLMEFAALAAPEPGQLHNTIALADSLATPVLSDQIWQAIAALFRVWRWRDRSRLAKEWTQPLRNKLFEALPGDWGPKAADILIRFRDGGCAEQVEDERERITAILPDLSPATREVLADWIESRGLPTTAVAPKVTIERHDTVQSSQIFASMDLEALTQWCCSPEPQVASDAVLRLIELNEPGMSVLADLLSRAEPPPHALLIAESLGLWSGGAALDRVRQFVTDPTADCHLRFRAGMERLKEGESRLVVPLLEAACTLQKISWFRADDWKHLCEHAPKRQIATRLAVSPHPHAYRSAIDVLAGIDLPTESEHEALKAFLECGTERFHATRLLAAQALRDLGDLSGWPILVGELAKKRNQGLEPPVTRNIGRPIPLTHFLSLVESILLAGEDCVDEILVIRELDELRTARVEREETKDLGLELVLKNASFSNTRQAACDRIRRSAAGTGKLRRIVDDFQWGRRKGRELLGRVMGIEMIGSEDLGYTRLEGSRVFINPLPVFRNERNGSDCVRGLILHEFGHHLYHSGRRELAVWDQAKEEGLSKLLNLVSDEHLERNLRSLDEAYGDKLKRLAVYAFQQSACTVHVDYLLEALGARAFETLTASRLAVAWRKSCVRVEQGQVMAQLEKVGHSFGRFMRALRMGLGNRFNDPKVGQALKFFRGAKFREASMDRLLEIARELREIFGSEVRLLDAIGPGEAEQADADEMIVHGEGITDQEIQEEIRRVHEPPGSSPGSGGPRCLNVGDDIEFEQITTIEPVPYDRRRHAELAREVIRPARQLRAYLENLGVQWVPQSGRLSGKRIDRSRLLPLVTRCDPRVLKIQERRQQADLFLGVAIDCSGSMQYEDNMHKARLCGVMLAEAVKNLRGLDLKIIGFTDCVIYDAGDAEHPSVSGLDAGGGNNDAAALWHLAQVASLSRRKTRLLVMISDGLPTECSCEALRKLAENLTRRERMCCAQLAVRPLEEILFPHYTVVQYDDMAATVRDFGKTIVRLISTAMRE